MFGRLPKKPVSELAFANSHDPSDEGEAMKKAHFTNGLSEIVLDYLDDDFNFEWSGDDETKPFSEKEFRNFKLFGVGSKDLMRERASSIATLILSGEGEDLEKAMGLVKKNPHIIHCVALVSDRLQRPVEGTLLQIAAMAGDVDLKRRKRCC